MAWARRHRQGPAKQAQLTSSDLNLVPSSCRAMYFSCLYSAGGSDTTAKHARDLQARGRNAAAGRKLGSTAAAQTQHGCACRHIAECWLQLCSLEALPFRLGHLKKPELPTVCARLWCQEQLTAASLVFVPSLPSTMRTRALVIIISGIAWKAACHAHGCKGQGVFCRHELLPFGLTPGLCSTCTLTRLPLHRMSTRPAQQRQGVQHLGRCCTPREWSHQKRTSTLMHGGYRAQIHGPHRASGMSQGRCFETTYGGPHEMQACSVPPPTGADRKDRHPHMPDGSRAGVCSRSPGH